MYIYIYKSYMWMTIHSLFWISFLVIAQPKSSHSRPWIRSSWRWWCAECEVTLPTMALLKKLSCLGLPKAVNVMAFRKIPMFQARDEVVVCNPSDQESRNWRNRKDQWNSLDSDRFGWWLEHFVLVSVQLEISLLTGKPYILYMAYQYVYIFSEG